MEARNDLTKTCEYLNSNPLPRHRLNLVWRVIIHNCPLNALPPAGTQKPEECGRAYPVSFPTYSSTHQRKWEMNIMHMQVRRGEARRTVSTFPQQCLSWAVSCAAGLRGNRHRIRLHWEILPFLTPFQSASVPRGCQTLPIVKLSSVPEHKALCDLIKPQSK